VLSTIESARAGQIEGQLNGGRPPVADWVVKFDGAEHTVSVGEAGVTVDGRSLTVDVPYVPGQRLVEAKLGNDSLSVRVERKRAGWRFTTRGASHTVRVFAPHVADLSHHMIEKLPPDLSRFLLCPMPGLVKAVHVAQGDKVEAGQPLAVVEAMKMENILRAEKAATVSSVLAKPGDSLAVDAVILEFE
jgi:propionyl-CoA carboxylase alpha chain